MVFKQMQAQMVNHTRALPQWVVFVTGFQAADRGCGMAGVGATGASGIGDLQTEMPRPEKSPLSGAVVRQQTTRSRLF